MLTAFVQHRHNHGNTARLALDSSDNAFQVLEMIVRAHRNLDTAHIVGNTVVEAIGNDVYIPSAHRLMDQSLCLAGTETGAICIDHVCSRFIAVVVAPFLQVSIDLIHKLLTAAHTDDSQLTIQKLFHDNPLYVK